MSTEDVFEEIAASEPAVPVNEITPIFEDPDKLLTYVVSKQYGLIESDETGPKEKITLLRDLAGIGQKAMSQQIEADGNKSRHELAAAILDNLAVKDVNPFMAGADSRPVAEIDESILEAELADFDESEISTELESVTYSEMFGEES